VHELSREVLEAVAPGVSSLFTPDMVIEIEAVAILD
jgi:hypothetical protein